VRQGLDFARLQLAIPFHGESNRFCVVALSGSLEWIDKALPQRLGQLRPLLRWQSKRFCGNLVNSHSLNVARFRARAEAQDSAQRQNLPTRLRRVRCSAELGESHCAAFRLEHIQTILSTMTPHIKPLNARSRIKIGTQPSHRLKGFSQKKRALAFVWFRATRHGDEKQKPTTKANEV
jgi:hypothetical protein